MAETRDTAVLAAEAFARGKRSLVLEEYTAAAEELSQVCEMLTELHGPTGDQLAEAYLLYGRSLLGCAREEAKLLDITETAPAETQDSENEVDSSDKATKDKTPANVEKKETNEKDNNEAVVSSTDEISGASSTAVEEKIDDKEASGDTADDKNENDEEDVANPEEDEDEESEGDVGNLQLAWEVLELSSQILSSKEDEQSQHLLAEVFSELGEVSLESSNFETAVKDFGRSLELYEKLEKPMPREIAEAHFKIGLSHGLMNMFEEAVKDFTKAADIVDVIIKETPAENESLLKELNQTKEDILLKITDVKESKEQSIDAIREQLNKVWPKNSNASENISNGASTSGSAVNGSAAECSQNGKPAADISHLIKRKRKTDEADEASTPKKATP